MKNEHLKNWEISLLLALCVTLCASCWAGGRSAAIAGSLVRLHVIADSDDEYEQALKLRVRDSVLECLTPLLAGAEDAGEARDIIARSLPEVRRAAEGAAEGRAVAVELSREGYPTREVARIVGATDDAVRQRLSRARASLRDDLKGDYDDFPA